MRLVVIGGVAAGTKAASRARRVNPDLEITIYQEEPEISISECGLPYFLSGVVENRDDLIARTPEKFAEKDVEVLVRHRVEGIDPENKTLTATRPRRRSRNISRRKASTSPPARGSMRWWVKTAGCGPSGSTAKS